MFRHGHCTICNQEHQLVTIRRTGRRWLVCAGCLAQLMLDLLG